MSNQPLRGEVAWVSGAASGIGEAIAIQFAQAGAAVILVDWQNERNTAVLDRIRADGGQAIGVLADVSSDKDVQHSIERAINEFGGLSIVVNAAGIVLVKSLHETTEEEWARVMDVNVKSMYLSFRHSLPHFRKRGGGSIVNVASISSFVGQALTPVYTTSKHAVLGLTRSIALDYAADKIRCNCLCPGITDTPMLREHLDATGDPEGTLAKRLRRVPCAQTMLPEQVARAALYLASPESTGVTGTSLVIDGGYLAAAEWDNPSS